METIFFEIVILFCGRKNKYIYLTHLFIILPLATFLLIRKQQCHLSSKQLKIKVSLVAVQCYHEPSGGNSRRHYRCVSGKCTENPSPQGIILHRVGKRERWRERGRE